jgi:hypothetical protein
MWQMAATDASTLVLSTTVATVATVFCATVAVFALALTFSPTSGDGGPHVATGICSGLTLL